MSAPKPCPLCQKPMVQVKTWKGMWLCPDNTYPDPKCEGSFMTDQSVEEFEAELTRQWINEKAKRN